MRKVVFAASLILTMVAGGCNSSAAPSSPGSPGMGRSMPAPPGQSSTEDGLRFELRDGSAPDASGESVPVAAAQPLSAERTAALLERVPALDADPTLRQDFSLRPAATPAPRTGATVQAPWPPADERDPPAPAVAAELSVVRAAP